LLLRRLRPLRERRAPAGQGLRPLVAALQPPPLAGPQEPGRDLHLRELRRREPPRLRGPLHRGGATVAVRDRPRQPPRALRGAEVSRAPHRLLSGRPGLRGISWAPGTHAVKEG
ncbi:hypothetical protein DI106_15650, partial [Legionella pneumophila]